MPNPQWWQRPVARPCPGLTRLEAALFILILLGGAAVRLTLLGSVPVGLNSDEAAVGYDAWSVVEHGVDRWGYPYPAHFVAWGGSGQNAAYHYAAMPFIKTLGLNLLALRLPQALLGTAALLAMYAVGRRMAGREFALVAMFLLAIAPWHIMASRWALDASILPNLMLFAFAALLGGLTGRRCIIPAGLLLALTLYSYGTAYLFVPLFTLGVGVLLALRQPRSELRYWVAGLVAMAAAALPITLFLVINLFNLAPVITPFLSIPKYVGPARYTYAFALFDSAPAARIWHNVQGLLSALLTGDDGFLAHGLPGFGYLYPGGLALCLLGVGFMVYDLARGRRALVNMLVLLWLAAGLLTAVTVPPGLIRANIIWMPLVIGAAYGLYRLWTVAMPGAAVNRNARRVCRRALRLTGLALTIYLVAAFAAFTYTYFTVYTERQIASFYPTYPEALRHIIRYADESETVYMTQSVPYTHLLFQTRPDPRAYRAAVDIEPRPDQFMNVRSFDRYVFGVDDNARRTGNVFLLHNRELASFPAAEFAVVRFGYYNAVYRR